MKKFFSFLLVFMLSLNIMVSSSHAALTDFPEHSANTLYFVGEESDGYWLYAFIDGLYYIDSFKGSQGSDTYYDVTLNFTQQVSHHTYQYDNESESWVYKSSSTNAGQSFYNLRSIQYSSADIYDRNGNIFFQNPPVVPEETTIQKLMNQYLPIFQSKTVGAMMILTVCGVGLIALLVALNLFGKVSRIFHLK